MTSAGSDGEPLERVLAEQRRYYRERAPEYEDWWYRRGRYSHGEEADERWRAEVALLEQAVAGLSPAGRVLELACGTGLWTAALAPIAARVEAIDAAPEALAIAAAKLEGANVTFTRADLFAWEPAERYDLCFFSFWLSHVPDVHWAEFWGKLGRALAPGGQVYLIDSARSTRASARDHALNEPGQELSQRRLADGREFTIVKHWFEPRELAGRIEALGWSAEIHGTGEFFVHGRARQGI